jgi:hypothetical protein
VNDWIMQALLMEYQVICSEFDKTRVWAEAEYGQVWYEHPDIIDVKNRIKAKVKEICGVEQETK